MTLWDLGGVIGYVVFLAMSCPFRSTIYSTRASSIMESHCQNSKRDVCCHTETSCGVYSWLILTLVHHMLSFIASVGASALKGRIVATHDPNHRSQVWFLWFQKGP